MTGYGAEDWPTDDEPRQCRRWDSKHQSWRWKMRFDTRKEAADKAGKGMTLYVCSECGFWHRASNHSSQPNRNPTAEEASA